ncbi:uncharacterized protein METZ01_LOCUS330645 [marine metagenome]|uniref:Uncharacterized protein n=1 Tax=marine metagenome TaxID=408172 RepID=A0A382Q0L9_9ZZZZ
METMLAIFGAKWCCVFASTAGGLTNGLVHTWIGWKGEIKNLLLAAATGWIAAEFFIPALMEQFKFGPMTALAIAFVIGYMGIRLLPHLEKKITKKLDKAIDSIDKD